MAANTPASSAEKLRTCGSSAKAAKGGGVAGAGAQGKPFADFDEVVGPAAQLGAEVVEHRKRMMSDNVNYRTRFWVPFLRKLGLSPVTPHSARHSFISTLQAQGVEVGLVAKLAGHKSAVVTLSNYTHAMRGGDAVKALDRPYGGRAS